jgi:hypothetical protein
VVIDAFLRAKGLECPTMPHHPEFAAAARAMIFHGFTRLGLHRTERSEITTLSRHYSYNAAQHFLLQCTISMRK